MHFEIYEYGEWIPVLHRNCLDYFFRNFDDILQRNKTFLKV